MGPIEEENLKDEFIERVWKDPAFKARALADPNSALKEMGVKPPSEFEIRILCDSPEHLHWVIPVESDEELLEVDLEAVAGGMSGLGQMGGPSMPQPEPVRRLGSLKKT